MDLVRLEDAVEKPVVLDLKVVVAEEAGGGVVIPGRRDREQVCHRLCEVVEENTTNSPRDMQRHRHACGWTYRDSSWRA